MYIFAIHVESPGLATSHFVLAADGFEAMQYIYEHRAEIIPHHKQGERKMAVFGVSCKTCIEQRRQGIGGIVWNDPASATVSTAHYPAERHDCPDWKNYPGEYRHWTNEE